MLDEPTEECGIMGMYSTMISILFSFSVWFICTTAQRSGGLWYFGAKDGKIHSYKDEGLVLDVFKSIENPETYMGIPLSGIPVIQLPEIRRSITINHSLQRMNMIRLFCLLPTMVILPTPEY